MQCQEQFPCWKWSLCSVYCYSAISSPFLSGTHGQKSIKHLPGPWKQEKVGGYWDHTGGLSFASMYFRTNYFFFECPLCNSSWGQPEKHLFSFQCRLQQGSWVRALRCLRSQPWVFINMFWGCELQLSHGDGNLQRRGGWTDQVCDTWSGSTVWLGNLKEFFNLNDPVILTWAIRACEQGP